MRVSCYAAPASEPVTTSEVKTHLNITTSDDDTLIALYIKVAREHTEDVTRRAILPQTWDYSLDGWPDKDYIKLPFGNLTSVTSVKWKDTDGTETTLAVTTDYLVEANGEACGRIVLPYGETWPSGTLYPSNPITIRFVCGWATAANVPERIKQAIKMMVSDLYEMRGEPTVGQTVVENKTVDRLLFPLRLWDEF